MPRFLAYVLAAIMALMPLAGMAGNAADGSTAHEMPCHGSDTAPADEAPADEAPASCADMKGCCAAFLLAPLVDARSLLTPDERPMPVETVPAGYVPDQPDRPPVGL
jgi:hypothetical protein